MNRCLFGLALLLTGVWSQEEPPPPVVRVTVSLVQLDAVVTDSKGRHVADLTKDDFEVYQDGAKQKITHFAWVPGVSPQRAAPRPTGAKQPAPVVVAPARAETTRRTIVLLVDNSGLSFTSMAFVRQMLKKFVREQIGPGDVAAVIQTTGGMGAFQRFTNDPRLLGAAIDHLRWDMRSRGGISPQGRRRARRDGIDGISRAGGDGHHRFATLCLGSSAGHARPQVHRRLL